MSQYHIIPYNREVYNFESLILALFETDDLSSLHEKSDAEYKDQFQVGMDSSTIFHTQFYDKYRSGWDDMQKLYELFVAEIIAPKYGDDFLYQAFPTFRVHLPRNVAVGAFHNDAEFGHPAGEVNFILPMTNSNDTASVWVESEPGKKDFNPIKMTRGTIIQFNGNELTHGNKMNDTGLTRVSMDFRILPISKYDEHNASESVTRKAKFTEGQYYKRFTNGRD